MPVAFCGLLSLNLSLSLSLSLSLLSALSPLSPLSRLLRLLRQRLRRDPERAEGETRHGTVQHRVRRNSLFVHLSRDPSPPAIVPFSKKPHERAQCDSRSDATGSRGELSETE